MRARGNIYFRSDDSYPSVYDYVPTTYSILYTAKEFIDGTYETDKSIIRSYVATAYCGDGSTPVINSTT